jgi:hypothetical protein
MSHYVSVRHKTEITFYIMAGEHCFDIDIDWISYYLHRDIDEPDQTFTALLLVTWLYDTMDYAWVCVFSAGDCSTVGYLTP